MDLDPNHNSRPSEEPANPCSSFDALYLAYKSAVYSFSIYLTRNRGEAEDLFQETWLRIVRKNLAELHPQKIKAWIFTIAVNLHRDNLRKQRIRRLWRRYPLSRRDTDAIEQASEKNDAGREDPNRDNDIRRDISQALTTLPEQQRRIFVLKEIAGFKQTEISEMLELPLGTVKSLMHRAVKHLQKELSAYSSDYKNNSNRRIKCNAKTLSF